MLPLERFRSFITEFALFDHSDRILLAVSAGRDSVLMVHFFNASGLKFGIAHCNFKLRAEESDLDEDFSRNLAKQLDVPFYSVSFDTDATAKSEGISIQMAARELRYAWLEKIRKENDYDYIALAQHKNDSVETVLLNLVRGTGIAGLHGILPKRDRLLRPLLFLTREEIDELIDENNIPYREDSSNLSAKYIRNKLRMEVIPKLKELNPNLEKTFEENSRHFAGIEEYFKLQMDALREKLFKEDVAGVYSIDIKDLADLHPQQTILFELFRPFNFSGTVLSDLNSSWKGNSGKVFESATHTLLLDRERLILSLKNETIIQDTLVYENDEQFSWGDHSFTSRKVGANGLEITKSEKCAYFDARLISFPLKFRSWKQGDGFYPLGMNGKKKLSDFFINKKIPLTEKHNIPILENGNGDIIWIAGYQSDNRYKVNSQSEKVLIFELSK